VASFFSKLFGTGAATAATVATTAVTQADPLNPAAEIITGAQKIIGMFKLSPDLKAQLQAQLTQENLDMDKANLAAELTQVQGQLQINEEEAKSTNWFVAGWRPAVGWVCAFALFYAFIFQPFAQFIFVAFHVNLQGPLPVLNTDLLVTGLLLPLLGLGTLRTVEKVNDAAGNH
jgi:hypothetical protein